MLKRCENYLFVMNFGEITTAIFLFLLHGMNTAIGNIPKHMNINLALIGDTPLCKKNSSWMGGIPCCKGIHFIHTKLLIIFLKLSIWNELLENEMKLVSLVSVVYNLKWYCCRISVNFKYQEPTNTINKKKTINLSGHFALQPTFTYIQKH